MAPSRPGPAQPGQGTSSGATVHFDVDAALNEWRVVQPDDPSLTPAIVEVLLQRAVAALDAIFDIDLDDLDATTAEVMVVGTEHLRRTAHATTLAITRHVDRERTFRGDGFFNATAYLKHRLQLSGSEAHQRVQMARNSDVLDRWAGAHAVGAIGSGQFRLMARLAANPRIDPVDLEAGSVLLWCDALDCSFAEFKRRALQWEALADPVGALEKAERASERRAVTLRLLDSGGWGFSGRLDDIGGAEFNEIFAHFTDTEWRKDWREATDRLTAGDPSLAATITVTSADLRRTQDQRRCDALVAMARAAAANGSGVAAEPTVNFLIDHDTARSIVLHEPIDPQRYRDVTSRTSSGHPMHPRSVVNCAMWAHVRRVVTDAAGVVIDLGRRARLFTGPSREAVMLLEDECAWVGCDVPTDWCDADHSRSWKGQGPTAPNNGGPLCRRHNVVKEQGYRVVRSPDGTWHTYDPDGREIC